MSTLPQVPAAISSPASQAGMGPPPAGVGQPQAAGWMHSEFEDVLDARSLRMRFAPDMEARYQADNAPRRLHELRGAIGLFIILNLGIFAADWPMVPDQFRLALGLRLLVMVPLGLAALALLGRVGPRAREWLVVGLSAALAAVSVVLTLRSTSALAPAYLAALEAVLVFNSGVAGMRWREQSWASALVLAAFAAGVWFLPDPPMVLMAGIALVLGSTTLYTLVGAYRLEREDRSYWLMRQHEQVLLAQLQAENTRLAHLSRFDPLTGLANRRHFDAFLAQVWGRCQHAGEEVALLMLDIDHFKSYNDRHGHPRGDLCLRAVADTLQGLVRKPEDLIARFGGEEFVAVLPRSGLVDALAAAERLRAGVMQLALPHEGAPPQRCVTLSIGVACVRANAPGATPARLMAAADAALYWAKTGGRNRVELFDQPDLPAPFQADELPVAVPQVPEPRSAKQEQERDAVLAASAALEKSDWRWRLPAGLERKYVDSVGLRLHYFQVSGLLSLLIFNGFLFVDYLMIPDVFELALKVRLGMFTPLVIAILLGFHFGDAWLRRHARAQAVESLVLACAVLAALCLMFLLASSTDPLRQCYHVGLVVIVVYVNTIQRLRFPFAAAFSVIVLGLSVALGLMVPGFDPRLNWPITLLLAASALFTLLPVHAWERDERRRYLLMRRRAHLLEDWADVQRQLQALSSTDALTGLSNRRHLQDRMQQIWRRAAHDGAPVAILMIDVDHFKAYNDHYGHPAGDRCLSQVAQLLADRARGPGDIVARYGGEEFIAVLPGAEAGDARRVAERIREAVQALALPHEASATAGMVTVSIGVASVRAQPGRGEAALLALADGALYEAKQAGRNRVRVAQPTSA